ncbi:MFS transporter [Streptomyces sp. NPDC059788]|uniref:MFS transporter n=1 Tax=Streptomyces sp. NPDC059788 TaxID=3346948 RepID=UPI003661EFDA
MTEALPTGPKPSGGGRTSRTVALALISLAQLMITLDSTIVSVALPSMQSAVGLSDTGRQWAVTSYTLAFGGLLLIGGRLGDLIGRKRAMLIGVAGFALASALGGAASSATMLISARALQGVFAALIAPSTLALITTTFTEPRERAKALGVYTASAMSGGAIGLVVGGALTDYLGWRWCLYVNVPIAVVVLLGATTLTAGARSRTGARLDLPGAALCSLGMLALIYGLGEATTYGWGSVQIIGALLASAVLLTAFILWQRRAAHPLLPLRVLTNRNSAASFLALMISAFCTFGMLLGMTYQLQTVMGYSPLKTGLAFLGYVGTAVVFSTQVARRLVARMRLGVMMAAGLVMFCLGLLSLVRLGPDATYPTEVLPALLLFGIGVGTLTVPAMTVVMSVTEARDSGVVSAIVNTAQQAGGSVGATVQNTISLSAAAGYLAARHGDPAAEVSASVHGFVVASVASAGLALVGALIAVFAINAQQPKPAHEPDPGRETVPAGR